MFALYILQLQSHLEVLSGHTPAAAAIKIDVSGIDGVCWKSNDVIIAAAAARATERTVTAHSEKRSVCV